MKRFLLMAVALHAVVAAVAAHWTCNPHDYRYDMTVYAQLVDHGQVVADYGDYEFAALVGDECRGTAQPVTLTVGGKSYTYLLLRVRSNQPQGETVLFKAYRKSADMEMTLWGQSSMPFVADSVAGTPSRPIALELQYRRRGDINCDGLVDIADVNLSINLMLGREESYRLAGDLNGDGLLDIADLNIAINLMLGKH